MNFALRFSALVIVTAGVITFSGCGASAPSGSTGTTNPPPPASDFSIDVGGSFQIQEGGIPEGWMLQVSISGAAPVSLTFPKLPPGITVTPGGPISVPDNFSNPTVLLYASSAATVGTNTITVVGNNGIVSHSYTLALTVTNPAPFQLQLSPASLSLAPGGAGQVQATITSTSSTAPVIQYVSATSDPQRQDLDFPHITSTGTNSYSLAFSVDYDSANASNLPVFITAQSSSGDTSSVMLPVSINSAFPPITAANRTTVVRTDQAPENVIYDQARRLLFLAIPGLNQVRVLSSIDFHTVANIPVPQFQALNPLPATIDEAVDGSKIFVGGANEITTIDPSTLEVTGTTRFPDTTGSQLSQIELVTLSTGNILALNMTAGDLYLWNPATGSLTLNNAAGMDRAISLLRSGNHNRVLVFGTAFDALYDAPSGSFITEARSPADYEMQYGGLRSGAALNPDGTQLAVTTSDGLSIYDETFNPIATQPSAQPGLGGSSIYSLDGSTLYLIGGKGYLGEDIAFDTHTYAPTGLFGLNGSFIAGVPLAVDETGLIYGSQTSAGTGQALIATDASHPGAIVEDGAAVAPSLTFPDVLTNAFGSLTSTEPTTIQGANFDSSQNYKVFVGAPPASPSTLPASGISVVSSTALNFTTPQGMIPGPANVTLTRPDGWFSIIPDALSYGPTILAVTPNTVPASGQSALTAVGYAFGGPVSIGGNSATTGREGPLMNNGGNLFPFQQMTIQAPSGSPGNADLTEGTASLASGIHYLQDQENYAISGGVGGLAYDQARQRLYISNTGNNSVLVFDLAAKSFGTPIAVGNGPTQLILTPDGTELAVMNATDGTVSVIDPSQGKVFATYPVLSATELQDQIRVLSMTQVAPHYALFAVRQRRARLLNLDTGSLSCAGIAGCDSTGINIYPGFGPALVTSTPDGTKAFLMEGQSQTAVLDITANTISTKPGVAIGQTAAAVNQDGSVVAAGTAVYDGQLDYLNQVGNDLFYLNTSLDNVFANAECFNPSGSLLFIAGEYFVDVYDVHTSRLVMQIAESNFVNFGSAQAMDETGTKLFSVDIKNGLTISQLAAAPLSIISVTPKAGPAGTAVTIRGSGFESGSIVKFGSTQVSASYVDSMTITADVQATGPGPLQVTVINPDGTTYSYDAAFDLN